MKHYIIKRSTKNFQGNPDAKFKQKTYYGIPTESPR